MQSSRRVVAGAASTGFHTGEEGRQRAVAEREKQKAYANQRKVQFDQGRKMPMRFYMTPGETKQFIIVDEAPSFFMFEHNLQDPRTGKWGLLTGCVQETDVCPICEHTAKPGNYVMFLTIIDLTPFTRKNGTTEEFSKKLLVVKSKQQALFLKAYERQAAKGGSLRGALYEATRDQDKDSRIGNNLQLTEFLAEDELSQYVSSWTDRDGKAHTDDCSVAVDYPNVFEQPNVDTLRAIIGVGPSPGSREHARTTLRERPSEPETGFQSATATASGAWEDDDDEDEANIPPARTVLTTTAPAVAPPPAASPAPRPVRRVIVRKAVDVTDDEADD